MIHNNLTRSIIIVGVIKVSEIWNKANLSHADHINSLYEASSGKKFDKTARSHRSRNNSPDNKLTNKMSMNSSLQVLKFNISMEEDKLKKIMNHAKNKGLFAFEPTSSIKFKHRASKIRSISKQDSSKGWSKKSSAFEQKNSVSPETYINNIKSNMKTNSFITSLYQSKIEDSCSNASKLLLGPDSSDFLTLKGQNVLKNSFRQSPTTWKHFIQTAAGTADNSPFDIGCKR